MECGRLAYLWVLGDKPLAVYFHDAVSDALCEKIKEISHPINFQENHLSIKYGDGIDPTFHSRHCGLPLECRDDSYPGSRCFLGCVLPGLRTRLARSERKGEREEDAPCFREDCTYHSHIVAGKPCYKAMFPPTRGSLRPTKGETHYRAALDQGSVACFHA